MQTYVEFRSNHFPPVDGEADKINPGIWGERLAEYLVVGLKKKGFEVSNPIAEDWGYVIKIKSGGFSLWMGCANYREYDDGFLCFINPNKSIVHRWFRKYDNTHAVMALQAALNEILQSDPSIYGIRWWTHEEFNAPRK